MVFVDIFNHSSDKAYILPIVGYVILLGTNFEYYTILPKTPEMVLNVSHLTLQAFILMYIAFIAISSGIMRSLDWAHEKDNYAPITRKDFLDNHAKGRAVYYIVMTSMGVASTLMMFQAFSLFYLPEKALETPYLAFVAKSLGLIQLTFLAILVVRDTAEKVASPKAVG